MCSSPTTLGSLRAQRTRVASELPDTTPAVLLAAPRAGCACATGWASTISTSSRATTAAPLYAMAVYDLAKAIREQRGAGGSALSMRTRAAALSPAADRCAHAAAGWPAGCVRLARRRARHRRAPATGCCRRCRPISSQIPDAVPRAEPRSLLGNPPFYEVDGHRYVVLASAAATSSAASPPGTARSSTACAPPPASPTTCSR